MSKHLSSPRGRLGEGIIQTGQLEILHFAQYDEYNRGLGGKAPKDSSHLIIRIFLFITYSPSPFLKGEGVGVRVLILFSSK